MGLLKRKKGSATPAPEPGGKGATAAKGRPLLAYFLPVGLVAAVVLVLVTLFSIQQLGSAQEQVVRVRAGSAAQSLADRVSAYMVARQEVLGLVSHSAAVRKALQGKDRRSLQSTAAAARKLLPEALQLRLFPPGQVSPDPKGRAPMGFAGVDMVRRALAGKQVGAEVHQIDSGTPYLALARPVRQGSQLIGAVFAAWPLEGLKKVARSALPEGAQRLWLVQGGVDGYVIVGNGDGAPTAGAGSVDGHDTAWQVYYRTAKTGEAQSSLMLWALLGVGLLVILLITYLQQRLLARNLRSDMAVLVGLGEAIADGNAPGNNGVAVASSRDAVLLLSDIAGKSSGQPRSVTVKEAAVRPAAAPREKEPATPEFSESTGIEVEESNQRPPVKAPAAVFRAYDIRGVAGRELDAEFAMGLGWAFGEMAHENGVATVYVAHDPRLSSPDLYEALCSALADIGIRVVELGMAPAALLYYAMHRDGDAGAVLVTGSHNPQEYNGFKLYLRTEPVQGEALAHLHERMQQGGFESRPGSREQIDLRREYMDAVAQEVTLTRPLHVVVDGGNGAAGGLACAVLEMLGCEVTPLFCEPDGRFPNHHPDPSQPGNLAALQSGVVERNADLGIAFDGDGDRIGVVDDQGQPVWPEHVLMLLATDILRRHPGSDVIYDVKSSRHLAGFVLAQGGRPIMWRSGHTRMKEKMRETGALLGGEFAGHFYIKERWYGSDDAIYVAARVLEVLADDPRPLHEQVAELPHTPATPEYQLPLSEGESDNLMQVIMAQASFPDARIVDLDGLRVEFPQAWGLVRASNTVPSLTFRFEADDEAELEAIKQRFRDLLDQVAPSKIPPF